MRRRWTSEEDEYLRQNYPCRPTAELAAALGRTSQAVYGRAVDKFRLRKSPAFMAALKAETGRRLAESGKATQLQPGLVPWNKGKPHPSSGRTAETQFKPGGLPHTWRPIGTERLTKEGYLERKVRDTCVTKNDYKAVHHIVWEEAGREIPPGHVLAFKDGNKRNFALENLELLTRKQLMARNTIHNYGPEVAQLAQLRGAIKRQINRLEGKK